jgi:hypothetical protein
VLTQKIVGGDEKEPKQRLRANGKSAQAAAFVTGTDR